jgi:hypothetical protein
MGKGEPMRGAISLAAFLLAAALLPMGAAAAEPRVGPPLDVAIFVALNDPDDPTDDATTATLDVSGRQCLPKDAPASVLVTVDQFPGKVFTATPDEHGFWTLDGITIPYPVETTYVINAECDNYFGTTVYPEVTAGPDDVITSVALPAGTNPPIANTGSRTAAELSAGLAALTIGVLLVWLARPRRAGQRVWHP